MTAMQNSAEWSFIWSAIQEKERELKRPLSPEERAQLTNTLLRGYGDKISLARTGNMFKRRVIVVDARLNRFYYDSDAALVSYIERVNEAIEAQARVSFKPEDFKI